MRNCNRIALFVLLLGVVLANFAQAQLDILLESWEGGVGNWTTAISNGNQVSGGASLATSAIGSTDGTSSLGITQFGDTTELDPIFNSLYSYDAEVRYSPGDAQLDALNTAFDIGAQHFELRYDVTYAAAGIPGGNLIRTGVGMEGGGVPFDTQQGMAEFNLNFGGNPTQLFNVAKPLSDWNVPQTGDATFFDISFGLNGNWGGGGTPATVYFDNLRLVQVSEPTILTLEINRDTGATRILNENGAGEIVELNYYEIVSPGGALSPTGWQPLDDFLIPDEGWTQAGGSSADDLTEANFLAFSDLDGNEFFSLGNAFTPGGSETGLAFRYREPSRPGALRDGILKFLGDPPGVGCDLDGSGTCDGTDIDLLVAEIVAGGSSFDLNGDGVITLADITDGTDGWLAQAGEENLGAGRSYLVGDANLDGVVDGLDFIDWNGNKFTSLAEWTGGDFNADGVVDGLDFIDWNSNKFMSSDAIAVPEPTGLAVFLTGCMLAMNTGIRRKIGIQPKGITQ